MRSKFILAATMTLALFSGSAATASADPLSNVLQQLDAAAKNFHSTQADFQFDTYEAIVSDHNWQKGTVYYERTGNSFRMAARISTSNGKPATTIYAYEGGAFKLFQGSDNTVTTYGKASKFESYLMLGFGASGKDLQQKWEIKYLGQETLAGVKTDKLELVPKDPAVRKNIPKVTVWIDPKQGVSLKQVFDEGSGQSRVCVYFDFKINQKLPGKVFDLPTNKKTQYRNQ